MRLTRWDFALGIALFATSIGFVQPALFPRPSAQAVFNNGEGSRTAPVSSWEAEQAKVKKRLEAVLTLNRGKLEQRIRQDPALFRRVVLTSWAVLFIGVGAFFSFFRFCWRLFTRQTVAPWLGTPFPPQWALKEILRLIALTILLVEWAFLAQRTFLRLRTIQPDSHLLALVNTLWVDFLIVLGAGILLARRRGIPSSSKSVGIGAFLRFGVVSYLTFLPFLGILVMMAATVLQWFGIEPSPQPVFTLFLAEERGPILMGLLILAAAAGPLAEELFFRGILYGWLRVKVGIVRALGISSLLFAVLHTDLTTFLPIFGLGLLFGWAYERTGSLITPVTIHVLHNAGMLYITFLLKSILPLA